MQARGGHKILKRGGGTKYSREGGAQNTQERGGHKILKRGGIKYSRGGGGIKYSRGGGGIKYSRGGVCRPARISL